MNLPKKIAMEIARVATLRQQAIDVAQMLNNAKSTAPLLMIIDASLLRAYDAIGDGDILAQIAVIQDLEGYK